MKSLLSNDHYDDARQSRGTVIDDIRASVRPDDDGDDSAR